MRERMHDILIPWNFGVMGIYWVIGPYKYVLALVGITFIVDVWYIALEIKAANKR